MTQYAANGPDWTRLDPGQTVTAGEIAMSWETMLALTDEERAGYGILAIVDAASPPAGKVETERHLVDMGGKPAWGAVYADAPPPPSPVAPDDPTLGEWRIGLTCWRRVDGGKVVTRLQDVSAAVAAMQASDDPELMVLGAVAHEKLEYSNNVSRADITKLAPAFHFTADEVEESLWRALRARLGDFSGTWPLPAGQDPFAGPLDAAA